MIAGVFTASIAGGASADAVFYDDFSDSNSQDGMPVTWVPFNVPTFPGTFDASSGDYVLTPSNRAIVATVDALALNDVSIRSQVRILDPPSTGGGFELLARASTSAATAYAAGLSDGGVLFIRRADSSNSQLARAETSLSLLDEDVVLQFDVIGTSLSLWAWPADESMPASPLLSAIDGAYAQGEVGIDYYSSEAVPPLGSGAFRYIHVANSHIANPGDYNDNGVVDAADYTVWRNGLGSDYSPADYDVWRAAFGVTYGPIGAGSGATLPSVAPPSATAPEPATIVLVILGALGLGRFARVRVALSRNSVLRTHTTDDKGDDQ